MARRAQLSEAVMLQVGCGACARQPRVGLTGREQWRVTGWCVVPAGNHLSQGAVVGPRCGGRFVMENLVPWLQPLGTVWNGEF